MLINLKQKNHKRNSLLYARGVKWVVMNLALVVQVRSLNTVMAS
jgi:hypothetical protein